LLIAVPILWTAYAAQTDWPPNKIALIAAVMRNARQRFASAWNIRYGPKTM